MEKAKSISTASWIQGGQLLCYTIQTLYYNLLALLTFNLCEPHPSWSILWSIMHTPFSIITNTHRHTNTHRKQNYQDLNFFMTLTQSAQQPLLSTPRTLALDSHLSSRDALTIISQAGINYALTPLHSPLLPAYYSEVGTLFWGRFLMFCVPFKYQPPHI